MSRVFLALDRTLNREVLTVFLRASDVLSDLVTAAQAFHWFDPEPYAREVARIQRKPAAWALVWNVRDPDANQP